MGDSPLTIAEHVAAGGLDPGDGLTLAQLVKRFGAGAPCELEAFLYFTEPQAAGEVARILAGDGYATTTNDAPIEGKWGVVARRAFAAHPLAIVVLRRQMDAFAAEHGGEFDGWGATGVRRRSYSRSLPSRPMRGAPTLPGPGIGWRRSATASKNTKSGVRAVAVDTQGRRCARADESHVLAARAGVFGQRNAPALSDAAGVAASGVSFLAEPQRRPRRRCRPLLRFQANALLAELHRLPPTVCHNGISAVTLFSDSADENVTVLRDWQFVGCGPIGSDLAGLICQAPQSKRISMREFPALETRVLARYLDGLHAAGWSGDAQQISWTYGAAAALLFGSRAVGEHGSALHRTIAAHARALGEAAFEQLH